MKRVASIGILVASLVAASAAMASPGGHDRDDHRERSSARHGVHHNDRSWAHHEVHRYTGPSERFVYRAPSRYGVYHRPHGYYAHRWVRGERLPVAYYARPYVIVDYRARGLRGPPRGYHWVRVDGDAVLAAVTTGIVLDTVFHVFH
jgi:Ni/Co efflux regulator RcnB